MPKNEVIEAVVTDAMSEAFRAWFFAHTDKRIFTSNARKAVAAILAAAPRVSAPTYEQGVAEGLRLAAKAASDQSALPIDAPAFSSGDYAAGYTSGAQIGGIRAAAAIRGQVADCYVMPFSPETGYDRV